MPPNEDTYDPNTALLQQRMHCHLCSTQVFATGENRNDSEEKRGGERDVVAVEGELRELEK